jgi:hypothetical protein
MSSFDLDASIRIDTQGGDVQPGAWKQLVNCGATPSKDHSVWIVDTFSEKSASVVDDALRQSLEMIGRWKVKSWWSNDWSVSVWTTISSTHEFVGVVIPARLSTQASSLGVDLIFSVYSAQAESDSDDRNSNH